jgi:hypothetical protein
MQCLQGRLQNSAGKRMDGGGNAETTDISESNNASVDFFCMSYCQILQPQTTTVVRVVNERNPSMLLSRKTDSCHYGSLLPVEEKET